MPRIILSQIIHKTEKASFHLLRDHLICNVMINGTLNTPVSYHSDKAQRVGSRLRQWNLLEVRVILSLYRKRQSDILMYYSVDGDLVH